MRYNFYIIVVFWLMTFFFIEIDCSAQNIEQGDAKVIDKQSPAVQDSARLSKKTPTAAMIRSLIFPGLGQWYNNKKLKAGVIFCAETGLLANAIYLNQQLVKSSDDWERNFYIENRNVSVWWLVGVTLFSMTDAFVDAHLADFDESPILSSLQIKPIISQRDGGFGLSVCFNF